MLQCHQGVLRPCCLSSYNTAVITNPLQNYNLRIRLEHLKCFLTKSFVIVCQCCLIRAFNGKKKTRTKNRPFSFNPASKPLFLAIQHCSLLQHTPCCYNERDSYTKIELLFVIIVCLLFYIKRLLEELNGLRIEI